MAAPPIPRPATRPVTWNPVCWSTASAARTMIEIFVTRRPRTAIATPEVRPSRSRRSRRLLKKMSAIFTSIQAKTTTAKISTYLIIRPRAGTDRRSAKEPAKKRTAPTTSRTWWRTGFRS